MCALVYQAIGKNFFCTGIPENNGQIQLIAKGVLVLGFFFSLLYALQSLLA
jgi:hypothetical protein